MHADPANDPGLLSPADIALLVDLYELTMSASYLARGITEEATFELFARRLPPHRDWLLAAGLGPTLELRRGLRFGEAEVDYLRSLGMVRDEFLDYLSGFRFTGDVEAIPEGSVVFANEPLLRVTAPLIEAQVVETVLLNQINFQTMIATKAARVVLAAGGGAPGAGDCVVDFSPRRDHGADAAMKVARSAAVAGCGGSGRWRTHTCSHSTPNLRRSAASSRAFRTTRRSSSIRTTRSTGSATRSRPLATRG